MSTELRDILEKTLEKAIKTKEIDLEQRLPRLKSVILMIKQAGRLDLRELIEGSVVEESQETEKDLRLLEDSNLVVGEKKFSNRGRVEYLEYMLTDKGLELAEKLQSEKD